ncbi:FIST N-terminal domain-containing protein [Solemya velum gill symbiont]|uniref:FIST N-terminal domain-containing protein n=1 Tax=Solemya velum gill symbiont TaxID=2340 RepID=UPI0009962D61|nr:FIST N-terminal domain-containing protein [Solemya velum gill symbiont]OOY50530.1 hypothetical protein BOV97_10875 [Solemya velum gill symbiont]OOY54709.1 hypothetical protein BOV99_10070 [Solemya velum gill symbiont]OOY55354.1 hypothetical protein BOW00_10075 [Solemya velum gill symbiont]OOY61016.1 hypothetical protein BOW04_10045 [Solemya velum gill symbiont]OOY64044.1 hypothetical protein BOW05_10985 [Solemya velum gill symbiont]
MYLPFNSVDELLETLHRKHPDTSNWLLYVSEKHADKMPELLSAATARGFFLYGGIFPGLIQGARSKDKGAIAIPLPEQAAVVTATLTEDSCNWQEEFLTYNIDIFRSALVFVDCLAPNVNGFLDDIYSHFGMQINYAGAGAGYHDLRVEQSIFAGEGMIPSGGLVVLLPDKTNNRVKHGWSRVAGPFIATQTNGNMISELNWESAGSFYRNEVEKLAPELKDKPVFPYINSRYPITIGKQAAEDVVRVPIDINPADDIVFLSQVAENSAIYISEGDKFTLIDAARQATAECSDTSGVTSCFVSDCFSRALMLGDDLENELNAVDEVLNSFTDTQAEGVLAIGEICGNKSAKLEFYNKTFVISLAYS